MWKCSATGDLWMASSLRPMCFKDTFCFAYVLFATLSAGDLVDANADLQFVCHLSVTDAPEDNLAIWVGAIACK